jgi:hypothetical protein
VFCWTYALKRWWPVRKDSWIAIRMSRYIPGIPHVVFVKTLEASEIEESIPEGEKKHGWRGVWHALTAKWTVRRGRGD